jgi:putative hemolysin
MTQPKLNTLPNGLATAPPIELDRPHYTLRFARSEPELDEILQLRFNVFNLELGEGLSESFLTGRDRDPFDETCHHLYVAECSTGEIVGTYRLQTREHAAHGWYSAGEFQMDGLPADVHAQGIELGRACILKSHRSAEVLFLMWQGIADYMVHTGKRYLFGCCSLTSQDPREGLSALRQLEAMGAMHPTAQVLPQPGFVCDAAGTDGVETRLPKLFRAYLRFGVKVCGPPAIDRDFQTIDFLILYDRHDNNAETARFFAS